VGARGVQVSDVNKHPFCFVCVREISSVHPPLTVYFFALRGVQKARTVNHAVKLQYFSYAVNL
jgi:hypothetical protein